jgi:isochorismate synthase
MNSVPATTILKENTKEIVKDLVVYGLAQGYSVAMWRLPSHSKINLILSSSKKTVNEFSIEESNPGFAFAPFDPAMPKFLLEAAHRFEITEEEVLEQTPGQIKAMAIHNRPVQALSFHRGTDHELPSSPSEFLELVKLSINAIEAGTFEKVVPSIQKKIKVNTEFDLLQAFDDLNKRYPLAMVSLVSDSAIGTWMGASPELLVSTDRNGIFRTVALAGTQVYNSEVPLRNISWTQKEIEEQALVERYIISCFKKIRVREYEEHGPKTVLAGNVIHLKSDFEVDMKDVNYPQLGSVMLQLLHPTSAVCGMPAETSLKFLKENEPHDREFYAGFLGPVNIDGETHIYVNLRCMKWRGDHILLFAGAGVTIDSVPEQEAKEVEIKMETILKALGL